VQVIQLMTELDQ